MIRWIIISTISITCFITCSRPAAPDNKTDIEILSYALGVDLGYQLMGSDSTMDPHLIAEGIYDVFTRKNDIDRDSAANLIRDYFVNKLPEKNRRMSEEFLEEVRRSSDNIQKSETGLMYEVIVPGNAVRATGDRDIVKVRYVGRRIDGRVFDSTHDQAVNISLDKLIPGWSEGMRMIGEGGRIRLWIPSDLAYGMYGKGEIRPFEALTFEVELLEVIRTS